MGSGFGWWHGGCISAGRHGDPARHLRPLRRRPGARYRGPTHRLPTIRSWPCSSACSCPRRRLPAATVAQRGRRLRMAPATCVSDRRAGHPATMPCRSRPQRRSRQRSRSNPLVRRMARPSPSEARRVRAPIARCSSRGRRPTPPMRGCPTAIRPASRRPLGAADRRWPAGARYERHSISRDRAGRLEPAAPRGQRRSARARGRRRRQRALAPAIGRPPGRGAHSRPRVGAGGPERLPDRSSRRLTPTAPARRPMPRSRAARSPRRRPARPTSTACRRSAPARPPGARRHRAAGRAPMALDGQPACGSSSSPPISGGSRSPFGSTMAATAVGRASRSIGRRPSSCCSAMPAPSTDMLAAAGFTVDQGGLGFTLRDWRRRRAPRRPACGSRAPRRRHQTARSARRSRADRASAGCSISTSDMSATRRPGDMP